jgi:hypothetical protein
MSKFKTTGKYSIILLLGFAGSAYMNRSEAVIYSFEYPPEIFYYCAEKYGTTSRMALDCAYKQVQLRNKILSKAKSKLGRLSEAERIYWQCADYHPENGVSDISKCVETRLVLRSKLDDDDVERTIYDRCYLKWVKHGSRAIDNCSRNEAN